MLYSYMYDFLSKLPCGEMRGDLAHRLRGIKHLSFCPTNDHIILGYLADDLCIHSAIVHRQGQLSYL
jgi:hypothetical protein